jgi:hypothetical protein
VQFTSRLGGGYTKITRLCKTSFDSHFKMKWETICGDYQDYQDSEDYEPTTVSWLHEPACKYATNYSHP